LTCFINAYSFYLGSSERNISIVVSKQDVSAALTAIHDSLVVNTGQSSNAFAKPHVVNVGVIGLGLVGTALLRQFSEQLPLIQHEGIDIRVRALMSSSKLITAKTGASIAATQLVPASTVRDSDDTLDVSPASIEQFLARVRVPGEQCIIVDNTSSMDIAQRYPEWLAQNISIVTPNKKAFSSQIELFQTIKKLVRDRTAVACLHETTVGAALPMLSTLRDLIRTGDKIHAIEGVLSGTLSYLFNTFSDPQNGRPFSEIVAEAKAKGYTEPDPRDDLSGLDVARKVRTI
jgi:aspartokinase/homoserine dehydrogenase 1